MLTEDAKNEQKLLDLEKSDPNEPEEENKEGDVANPQGVTQVRDQQASHRNSRIDTKSVGEFHEPLNSEANSNFDHGQQQLGQDQTVSKDSGDPAQGADNADKVPDANKNQVQANNAGGSTAASQLSTGKI